MKELRSQFFPSNKQLVTPENNNTIEIQGGWNICRHVNGNESKKNKNNTIYLTVEFWIQSSELLGSFNIIFLTTNQKTFAVVKWNNNFSGKNGNQKARISYSLPVNLFSLISKLLNIEQI